MPGLQFTYPVLEAARHFSSRTFSGRSTRLVPFGKQSGDTSVIRKGEFVKLTSAGVITKCTVASNYITDDAFVGWANEFDRSTGNDPARYIGMPAPNLDGAPTDVYTAAVNEVQTATITGSPTGGTFTLSFDGATTGALAYNASAATVQAALEALSTIGTGNVTVSGSAGGPYTITFVNAWGGQNVSAITKDVTGLTGGTSPNITMATSTGGAAAVTLEEIKVIPADGQHVITMPLKAGITAARTLIGQAADIYVDSLGQNYIDTGATAHPLVKVVGVREDQYGIAGGLVDVVANDGKSHYTEVAI